MKRKVKDVEHLKLLGEGGEAQVYALDETHVLRLYRDGATLTGAQARAELLVDIANGARHLPFETPQVIELGKMQGRVYAVEKRIAGESLLDVLQHGHGDKRQALIAQYMDVAWQLGTIDISAEKYGEINYVNGLQTGTFIDYLSSRARHNLAQSKFAHLDTDALAAALGEPPDSPAFVHLDYFAGNVMSDGEHITGVIDFGYSSIIGDRRMNVVAAAAHMFSPRITPTVIETDRQTVRNWLHTRDLMPYYEHGERWMAAYWSFVPEVEDPAAYDWCLSILSQFDIPRT